MCGCKNCRYYKYYPSNSWYDPDDCDCQAGEYAEGVWSDGKEWYEDEEPLCRAYEYDPHSEW